MKEIIKRQTAQEICDHRDESLRLMVEGIELIREAADQANKATSKNGSVWISYELGKLSLEKRLGEYGRDTIENLRKRLDADVWKSLYVRTGLGDHFDTQAREAFQKQLSENPPEVTIENVIATCFSMAGRQSEIFERSVMNLFRRLSRTHKSNNGFCFGTRMIFWNVVDGFDYKWQDVMRDLERVVMTISGAEVPDRVNGIISEFNQARKGVWGKSAGELMTQYFDLRWFNNGNMHVRIRNKEVIDTLNKIIADENTLNQGPKNK